MSCSKLKRQQSEYYDAYVTRYGYTVTLHRAAPAIVRTPAPPSASPLVIRSVTLPTHINTTACRLRFTPVLSTQYSTQYSLCAFLALNSMLPNNVIFTLNSIMIKICEF